MDYRGVPRKVSVAAFRIFGCPAYFHVYSEQSGYRKGDDKVVKGIFVGFSWDSPCYLVYVPKARRVYERYDVRFDELWRESQRLTIPRSPVDPEVAGQLQMEQGEDVQAVFQPEPTPFFAVPTPHAPPTMRPAVPVGVGEELEPVTAPPAAQAATRETAATRAETRLDRQLVSHDRESPKLTDSKSMPIAGTRIHQLPDVAEAQQI